MAVPIPSFYYFTKLYTLTVRISQRYLQIACSKLSTFKPHKKLLQKHTVRKIHVSVTRRALGKYAKFASCKQ